jgi:two-component system, chemotaxis family, protein-glutamate methylesterase/glutaminase
MKGSLRFYGWLEIIASTISPLGWGRWRTVATRLHEILPRFTSMPVDLITEGLTLRPNRVFIIPAQHDLHVLDGEFRLEPISKPRGWPDVITVFLRSMTEHWHGKLIAVIVSGYDGDGAEALCGIKDVGGITIAQKPETARQPEMPNSAMESGCIDFVLSPEDIAREIIRISREDDSGGAWGESPPACGILEHRTPGEAGDD